MTAEDKYTRLTSNMIIEFTRRDNEMTDDKEKDKNAKAGDNERWRRFADTVKGPLATEGREQTSFSGAL